MSLRNQYNWSRVQACNLDKRCSRTYGLTHTQAPLLVGDEKRSFKTCLVTVQKCTFSLPKHLVNCSYSGVKVSREEDERLRLFLQVFSDFKP